VNKFLGLRFIINGEVHYGWARFSVRSGYFLFALKLSGYAYETSPDTTILAGDRGFAPEASTGSDGAENASMENTPALQPASLGLLSLGSIGLDAWRQEQDWKVVPGNQGRALKRAGFFGALVKKWRNHLGKQSESE